MTQTYNPEVEPGLHLDDLVKACARVLRDPDTETDDTTTNSNLNDTQLPHAVVGSSSSSHQSKQKNTQLQYSGTVNDGNAVRYQNVSNNSSSRARRQGGGEGEEDDEGRRADSQERRREQELVHSLLDGSDVDAVLAADQERHRLEMHAMFEHLKKSESAEDAQISAARNVAIPPPPVETHHQLRQQNQNQNVNEHVDVDRLIVPNEASAYEGPRGPGISSSVHQPPSDSIQQHIQNVRSSSARSRSLPPPPLEDEERNTAAEIRGAAAVATADNALNYAATESRRMAPHNNNNPLSPPRDARHDFSQAAWERAHQDAMVNMMMKNNTDAHGIPKIDLGRLDSGNHNQQQNSNRVSARNNMIADSDSMSDSSEEEELRRTEPTHQFKNRPPLAPPSATSGQARARVGGRGLMAPPPDNAPYGHQQYNSNSNNSNEQYRNNSPERPASIDPNRVALMSAPLFHPYGSNSNNVQVSSSGVPYSYGAGGRSSSQVQQSSPYYYDPTVEPPVESVQRALESRTHAHMMQDPKAVAQMAAVLPSPRRVIMSEQLNHPPREMSQQRGASVVSLSYERPPSSVVAVIVPVSAAEDGEGKGGGGKKDKKNKDGKKKKGGDNSDEVERRSISPRQLNVPGHAASILPPAWMHPQGAGDSNSSASGSPTSPPPSSTKGIRMQSPDSPAPPHPKIPDASSTRPPPPAPHLSEEELRASEEQKKRTTNKAPSAEAAGEGDERGDVLPPIAHAPSGGFSVIPSGTGVFKEETNDPTSPPVVVNVHPQPEAEPKAEPQGCGCVVQ